MKREHWQNGQIVLTNDLGWAQQSKEESILDRVLDLFEAGTIPDTQFGAESYPFEIAQGDTATSINVLSGVAIGPTGERIVISTLTTYDAGNTALIPPLSTGSKNIPLPNIAANKSYWIWIRHFDVKDPSVFTLAADGTTKLYTKTLDGFDVRVTETNINPNVDYYISLGKIVTSSSGTFSAANTDLSGRQVARTKSERVGITISTARPATYAVGETKFIDDHVHAVGSGVPTPSNPHATTAEDLGLTVIEGQNHQSKLHSNGIYSADPTSETSALFPYVYAPSEDTTDRIILKRLSNDPTLRESAVVNGKTLTAASMSADVTITFTALPEFDGKYYLIYLDSADLTIKKSEPFDDDFGTAFTTLRTSYLILPICSIQWKKVPSLANPDNYDLIATTLKDWRTFGNTGITNIHSHIVAGLSVGSAVGNRVNTFYRGKATNTKTDAAYTVSGLQLNVLIDGISTVRTVTFTGADPIPTLEVIRQINDSVIGTNGALSLLSPTQNIDILAVRALEILAGTANAALGFTTSLSNDTLKQLITTDEMPGTVHMTYDGLGRLSVITSRYGNKNLIQTIIYLDATETSDIASITEEVN